MSCFQVTINLVKQLVVWSIGIVSWLVQQCSTVTRFLQQLQQQWQNRCTQETSRVCRSLPWPFNLLCRLVTTIVCTLVSVLILVVITIVLVICTIVTVFAIVLLLSILIIVIPVLFILCIVIPCSAPMESSLPPDDGWLVTLGEANPPMLSQGNTVALLPDGELDCQAMIAGIEKARQTIHLLQLEFDKCFFAEFLDFTSTCPPQPAMLQPTSGASQDARLPNEKCEVDAIGRTKLTQALVEAARRGVRIRILLNKNSVLPDSVSSIQAVFSGIQNIEVAGINTGFGVMHAKALIADGSRAFLVGLPFAPQGYWDTQLHCVTDPRRGSGAGGFPPAGEVGNGVGKKPVHTVSLGVSGPAATDVDKTFISLWNSVSTDTIAPPTAMRGEGSQGIQIVRTSPALNAGGLSNGEKGILESYLRAINNARGFIYLEAQYFTSPVIGTALSRALLANPDLQLILLLNENPDLLTYKFWQNPLLSQLVTSFPGRVGVFTLWRTQPPADEQHKVEIMQCYMEAKVSLVDDVWATIGSGNLDGGSLGHIFEFLFSPLSCISASKGWRNFEVNAVLYDGIADLPETGEVSQLRTLLWREHLGLEEIPVEPPAGGWLALWSQIARENIASLNATQTMSGNPASPSRILPYSPRLDTVGQLSHLGVNTDLFDVAPAVP
jgi:phosphatidylserine/phosphatidylglycerophosphate/cardiolipin synthase-like enzyme